VRKRAGGVALFLASVVAALALGEGIVRVFAPQALRPAWDDELQGIRVPRPNVAGRHTQPGTFDVTVSINSQRFRAPGDYAVSRAPGVTRVAVLGDSLAFGWGADDDETYPAQLERELARLLAPRRLEVMNAAFPGTCLGEKAAWYELGVRRFAPRLVVLTALGDDVDGDLHWRVFSRGAAGEAVPAPGWSPGPGAASQRRARSLFQRLPGYEWLIERSQLFGLARQSAARAVASQDAGALGQRPATDEEERRFREEGLPLLQAELRWLADRVAESGAALAVVFLPFRQGVYPDQGWWADELRWKSRAQSEALREVCAERGLPFKDVTEDLQALGRAEPALPLYHAGIDTHPTPAGYRAIAESVAAWLAEARVLSMDHGEH
jgi:lysophospholipase L1-like esterase